MSTALPAYNASLGNSIFHRFLWKEYRMLRGFWLAVGTLAFLVQLVMPLFLYDNRSVPATLFAVAWGAATLYAVGAAITLFSAEREEQTLDFLQSLPSRWLPMFTGKVLLAILSAVALAGVLSLTGFLLAGVLPTSKQVHETVAVLGVAIVEATVWGIFFSLWMKQPLLAAVVSMAAASLGAQVAVSLVNVNQAFTTTAYDTADKMRLLVCAVVFLVDMRIASRWLQPARSTSKGMLGAPSLARRAGLREMTQRVNRRTMLARLLWQTWRQSWKTMLAAIPIAMLLILAINATTWLSKTDEFAMLLCPLLLPALYGALVFRADQRGDSRQFLLTHASRPRYVWLARHMVWLSTLVLLGILFQVFASLLAAFGLHREMEQELQYNYFRSAYKRSLLDMYLQMRTTLSMFWSFTSTGWCAILAAYGVGQLCSMVLAREVLAGFLALLVATVLTAWAIVVGAWELNPAWFVLPIGVVALAATWVRAPDWILGRRGLRRWIAPTLTIALPLLIVYSRLPHARLNQLALPRLDHPHRFLQLPLTEYLHEEKATHNADQLTATDYEQVHAKLVPWEEASHNVRIDGKLYEELEFLQTLPNEEFHPPFSGFSVAGSYGGEMGGYGNGYLTYSRKLNATENAMLKRFQIARDHAYAAANQGVIEELVDLSHRKNAGLEWGIGDRGWNLVNAMDNLLVHDSGRLLAAGELEAALERLLTLGRIRGQMLAHQTTMRSENFLSYFSRLQNFEKAMMEWAQHPDQSSEKLKDAISDLQEMYAGYPPLRDAVVQDRLLLRDVLLDNRPPAFLEQPGRSWSDYLPYLANKLSWERERALQALDILTSLRLNYFDGATNRLANAQVAKQSLSRSGFGELFRKPNWNSDAIVNEATYQFDWGAYLAAREYDSRCYTSYLLQNEMASRVNDREFLLAETDAETNRRGLLNRLALLAYKLDHEAFPQTLAELTPDYLSYELLDPYSQAPFEYRPAGLELPLRFPLNHGHRRIPAGTPLLWSVGTSHFVLKAHNQDDEAHIGESRYITDPDSTSNELMYEFRATQPFWGGARYNVFPLPTPEGGATSDALPETSTEPDAPGWSVPSILSELMSRFRATQPFWDGARYNDYPLPTPEGGATSDALPETSTEPDAPGWSAPSIRDPDPE